MTAIFISHRSSDNAEAQKLKDWLGAQGHEQLFLDFDPAEGIPAGVDWEQRLYQELRRCQALLIVLTPAWLASKWCGNELAIAREKGKAVFVVRVAPVANGPIIPALQEVDLTSNRDAGLERLAHGLKEHGLDPRDAFDWKPGRAIYPGLTAFDIEDAAIFFGRSGESWQVVEQLRRMRLQAVGSPRLLLITGASGSGKSSLMRAGVLARLHKEPTSWIAARPFRRGVDALASLAEALAWAFPAERRPTSLEPITARLGGPQGEAQLSAIARELRLAHNRPEATLVLALDQAEELLAAERGDDTARLLDLFRAAVPMVGNEILVIATIRSDRLGGWQQHASIKATAEHGELPFEMLPLGPMPMARIGEIVRGPAAYEGLRVDDDLVDAIRADTASPEALPLLAYTLQYLHRHFAGDGRLTLTEYRSFGGLEGSVRSQADAAIPIDKLSEEDRSALKEAFVPGLVRATAEGGFSRSRAKLATLPPRAEPYLRRLIDEARLLTTDHDPEGGVTIEVAHESLLRVWPTLERWIAEDAQSLRRLEALQRAAADWAQSGHGQDFLNHRDHRLDEAEALIAEPRFASRLDVPDRDYLGACRNAQNEREASEKAAQEHELRDAQELARRRRMLFHVAVAALVLVLGVAGVAIWQWQVAEDRAADVRVKLLASLAQRFDAQATGPDLIERAGALAVESIERARKADRLVEPGAVEAARSVVSRLPLETFEHGSNITALAALKDGRLASGGQDQQVKLWPADGTGEPVILNHGAAVTSLAVLPDGRLASGGWDGRVKLWPADVKGELVVFEHGDGVTSLASLANGWLASGGNDGLVKLWPTDGDGVPVVHKHGALVGSLAVLPDGRLASGGNDGLVKLWPADGTGEPVVFDHGDPVVSLAVLADGRLASGGYGTSVKIWSTDSKGDPVVLEHGAQVFSLAVLVDGRVASGDGDGRVKLWPANGKGGPTVLEHSSNRSGFDDSVDSLAVLTDGRLASGGEDGRIKLWPADGKGEPFVLEQSATVSSLAVLADGRLASGDLDGRVKLWPANGRDEFVVLDHGNAVHSLAVLPDGRLASGGNDGLVKLWFTDGQGEPLVLDHGNAVLSLAVLPDGRLASGGEDGWVKLWPIDGQSEPVVLEHGARVFRLVVLADGRLASGGEDGRVKLWPANDQLEPSVLEHSAEVTSLAVLADGRLASGDASGVVKLWPADGNGEPVVLRQADPVISMTVLADGRLAVGGWDGRVRLWPADGRGEPVVLEHGAIVQSLAALADGRLASGGRDGQVKLWIVDTDRLVAALCLRAGRNLSREEWGRYVSTDEPWQPSCRDRPSNWRTVE